jgi:paraquat-inducible protein B
VPFDIHARPLVLPTINGGFDRLQEQIASIVSKVDKMPLASIAQNLNATLAGVDNSLKQVNGQTLPAANQLLRQMSQTAQTAQELLAEDSPLMLTFSQSLQEALRALRAVRNLADQLDRHPESLLQGRTEDPPLPNPGSHDSSLQGSKK